METGWEEHRDDINDKVRIKYQIYSCRICIVAYIYCKRNLSPCMRQHEIICKIYVENEVQFKECVQNMVNQYAGKYTEGLLLESNLTKQEKICLLEKLLHDLKSSIKKR